MVSKTNGTAKSWLNKNVVVERVNLPPIRGLCIEDRDDAIVLQVTNPKDNTTRNVTIYGAAIATIWEEAK